MTLFKHLRLLFSLLLASSFVTAPLSAQAGLVHKLVLGGVVVAVGTAVVKKNSEAKPLPGKPVKDQGAYLAEHQRRHNSVMATAAEIDINAVSPDVRESQCVAAATYTLLHAGFASYPDYVRELENEGYFNKSKSDPGISMESARYLLTQAGFENDYIPVELTNHKLVTQIANALDAGKAVFLRVDAVKAYELETKELAPLKGFADIVKTNWLGSGHLLRVTAVYRNSQGQPFEFGVYDVNGRSNAATLTGQEMLELLDTTKIRTAFRTGAIITRTTVFPAIKL